MLSSLKEAGVAIIDGDRGKNYPNSREFREKGHCLFLNAGNVTHAGADFASCVFVSKEKDELMGKGKLARNDVVLTTRGTVGNSAYFGPSIPFEQIRINSGMVILRATKNSIEPYYLYFVTRSHLFLDQVKALSTGSAQPQLPIRDLEKIRIPVPPLAEQRAIAHILGTLDDKIELNRRINQTLEEMAGAIYKDWFVDFGPVRAKMESQERYLPPELWELFPDRLVDSELGEIPEGWQEGTVSQLAEKIYNGGTPKRSEPRYWEGGDIPWLTSGEVRQPFILGTQNFITQEGLANSSTKMVPARSILVALYGATAGQVSINHKPLSTNQAVSAVIPSLGNRYFCLVNLKLKVSDLENRAVGSAQQNISKKAVESTKVLLPKIELRAQYDATVEHLFDQVFRNLDEAHTLSAKRDTLLPELTSGDVGLA